VFGCPPLLSFSEVGESSRGGGFEEIGGPPEAVIDLSFFFQTLGVSHEGNVKDFLDFMACSSFFQPKSSGRPPAQVSSAPAIDLKGKAPLVHPSFQPKLVFKAKVGSGLVSCDPRASSSSLDSSSLPPAGRAPMSP
jgi:hypothetical protein